MNELLTWGIAIVVVFGLIALGFNALQVVSSSDEFWIARGWFVLAAIVALARFIVWGIMTSRSLTVRLIVTIIACGATVALAVEGVRYVNRKSDRWIKSQQAPPESLPPPASERLVKTEKSEVSEKPISEPEPNLIYLNARVTPVGVDQYRKIFEWGDQGHAAVIDFMNAPDSSRLVSRIREVRGLIRFNEINGTQQLIVTKGVWLGAEREYVSLKPGDTAPLIAAIKTTNGENLTCSGRYMNTRRPIIGSIYRPEYMNLTGNSYHVNVKLIRGERESELIGEYDFKLTLEPEIKLEEIKPVREAAAIAPPKSESNLVFLRTAHVSVYTNDNGTMVEDKNVPRSAPWRIKHPTYVASVATYHNQPHTSRKVVSAKRVSAQLTYEFAGKTTPFNVPRALWFPQDVSIVDFDFNDSYGFVLVIVDHAGRLCAVQKGHGLATKRDVLPANEANVQVRLISEADGVIIKESKFHIQNSDNPFSGAIVTEIS